MDNPYLDWKLYPYLNMIQDIVDYYMVLFVIEVDIVEIYLH